MIKLVDILKEINTNKIKVIRSSEGYNIPELEISNFGKWKRYYTYLISPKCLSEKELIALKKDKEYLKSKNIKYYITGSGLSIPPKQSERILIPLEYFNFNDEINEMKLIPNIVVPRLTAVLVDKQPHFNFKWSIFRIKELYNIYGKGHIDQTGNKFIQIYYDQNSENRYNYAIKKLDQLKVKYYNIAKIGLNNIIEIPIEYFTIDTTKAKDLPNINEMKLVPNRKFDFDPLIKNYYFDLIFYKNYEEFIQDIDIDGYTSEEKEAIKFALENKNKWELQVYDSEYNSDEYFIIDPFLYEKIVIIVDSRTTNLFLLKK